MLKITQVALTRLQTSIENASWHKKNGRQRSLNPQLKPSLTI
jgi:hypothetical protein